MQTNLSEIRDLFVALLDADSVLDQSADLERYGRDWLKDFSPTPILVLLPRRAEQVCEIVRLCNHHKLRLVPSGGRTGLSGGATATSGEIVLSLERLHQILEIDLVAGLVTCQAGVVTQQLQEALASHNLFLPIDLASKGSSQIGGNIATNAGGIHVVRYGNMRNWVIGLKVITGVGELLNLNGKLFKNQTGYDLKNLFIGSEGTLGIIVEATLQLTRTPPGLIRAIVGLSKVDDCVRLLEASRKALPFLSAFEFFGADTLAMVVQHHKLRMPLEKASSFYTLIEIEEWSSEAREQFQGFLAAEVEGGRIQDAVVSFTAAQSEQLLRYRELIPETIATLHYPHKNDIAVPVGAVSDFMRELYELAAKLYPEYEVMIFGHLGDGNLHVNVLKPVSLSVDQFLKRCKEVDSHIFSLVQKHNGSISAEHGIGLLKKPFLGYSRTPEEIRLMREIKKIFDPNHILNPGKIFDL